MTVIRKHIGTGQIINGYGTLAELCGRQAGSTDARFFGQVASRIDAACFYAGLPMLCVHWVRNSGGDINPYSFNQEFAPFKDEILKASEEYEWTTHDFHRVQAQLNALPDESATSIWANVVAREFAKPGFIKYNLHRKLVK